MNSAPNDTADHAIVAQGLSKHYADFKAVDNLSFSVNTGQIVGLLGPNGAGKTTILRMLAGILQPTSGQISICGFAHDQQLFEIKKRIGFLSNDTQLYLRMSTREVLTYFGRLNSMPKDQLNQRIEELTKRFEMQDFIDKTISSLSSGQKQRANIARTIIHQPPVLILDEITTALDVISSQFIIDFLRETREQGTAVLFSTHIMSEAEYLCDDILLIYQGQLIDKGSPQALIAESDSSNLTAAFLARINQPLNQPKDKQE